MKQILVWIVLVVTGATASAQEAIVLKSPVPPTTPALSQYTPIGFRLDVAPTPLIYVELRANDGTTQTFRYPCLPTEAPACTTDTPEETLAIIQNLNTANLAVRSLWRRIMDRLVADFPSRFPGGATVQ